MASNISSFTTESPFTSEPPTSPLSAHQSPGSLPAVRVQGTRLIIFSPLSDQQNSFLAWWRQTHTAQHYEQKNINMIWGSQFQRSDIWESVQELAKEKTGLPKVQCQKCQCLFVHPTPKQQDTHSLQQHILQCGDRSNTANSNVNIMDSMQGQVSFQNLAELDFNSN